MTTMVSSNQSIESLLEQAIEDVRNQQCPKPLTPAALINEAVPPESEWATPQEHALFEAIWKHLQITRLELEGLDPELEREAEANSCGDLSIFAAIDPATKAKAYYLAPRGYKES